MSQLLFVDSFMQLNRGTTSGATYRRTTGLRRGVYHVLSLGICWKWPPLFPRHPGWQVRVAPCPTVEGLSDSTGLLFLAFLQLLHAGRLEVVSKAFFECFLPGKFRALDCLVPVPNRMGGGSVYFPWAEHNVSLWSQDRRGGSRWSRGKKMTYRS